MPETVILNPNTVWDEDLQDCMTPDYGFKRGRPSTRAVAKPPGGRPYSREVTNNGHALSLGWINRSYKCVQRVKQFYERFEDGFFTIVDWDGGGRHFVGRFTGDFDGHVEVANDKYTIQNLAFEEMPSVPMLQYPNDWARDAVPLYAFDDFGDPKLYTSGTWTSGPLYAGGPTVLTYAVTSSQGWATYEYRGYGFRLWLAKGPGYGLAEVNLDGVDLATIDCYAPQNMGLQMVFAQVPVALDLHRVKVTALTGKNAAATGSTISWGFLEAMR